METSQNFFENNINIDSNEPLLMTENNRLTVYPIMYHNIWSAYKTQVAAFWTAEEIDFSKDYKDFCSLNENEQHFIKMVLAFFAASDTIVNINLGERFIREVQVREAIVAYGFQMMIESIHSEVYSLMIDNIVKDTLEKNKLLNAITEYPCISNKALWAKKWIESNSTFAQRLIAFAIVEGIDATTGGPCQARHSFIPSEIEWDKSFAPCVFEDERDGSAVIDFSVFHDLVDVPSNASTCGHTSSYT